MTIIEAAAEYVRTLNAIEGIKPISHAVYVCGDEIHIAVRPRWKNLLKDKIPKDFKGYPVREIDWPRGG